MTKALNELLKDVTKNSKIKVTILADPESLCHVTQWLSTGCLSLDTALAGGFPVRRMIEIYGDNSTGKTLLTTQGIISTQEMGGFGVYADPETALDVNRLVELGVDPKMLAYVSPDTVDDVFQSLREMIKFKNKHLGKEGLLTYVWDSVASIATKDELEADSYEARNYPSAARSISGALRQIIREIADNNVCFLLTNQTRQKLGVMFGDGAVTYGGKAISFYSSVRIELQNTKKIRNGTKGPIVGVNTQATIVKNRLAPPFRVVQLPVYYDFGIDEAESVLELLKVLGLVELGGAWYTLKLNGEEIKFQKKTFFDTFEERYDDISKLIEDNYG